MQTMPLSLGALLLLLVSCGTQLSWASAPAKCIEDLGCFPIGPEFFHQLYRPINFVPEDRERINTKFILYTLAHPKVSFQLRAKDDRLFSESGFDVNKKTKVIVHGIIDNQIFGEWMREMKDEFLLNGDHNVIIVDWSGGNSFPYTQATANTRVVGAEVAFLLQWMKDTKGLKLEDCHILGHSLGAHVAGYAGDRLKTLGRITAMDPAEPFFQNLPPSVRIDPTDADFVDVVHTDSKSIVLGGLGMSQLVGHVDFFPNDGHSQPGCSKDKILDFFIEGFLGGARSFLACNHQRAVNYVKHSINSNLCVPVGYACPSWEMFLDGKCAECGPKGDRCAPMGNKARDHFYPFRNDTRQQKFYLKTGTTAPFCVFQYQVSVKLQKPENAKNQEGSLQVTLQGDTEDEKFSLNDGAKIELYHGATYTFLVTTKTNLGDITGVKFSWNGGFAVWPFNKKTIFLENIHVVPMNIVDPSTRKTLTRNYCAAKKGELKSKEEITLEKKDIC